MNRKQRTRGLVLIVLSLGTLAVPCYGAGKGGRGTVHATHNEMNRYNYNRGHGGFGSPGYGGCWLGGYGAWLGNGYGGSDLPYFSLFPPVYYSEPVAYPYGYSPYPNPPYGLVGTGSAPDLVAVAARDAALPFHRPPLRIVNPYVVQSDEPAGAAPTVTAPVQPQVVYPAALADGAR
jgi:hypothetical protein